MTVRRTTTGKAGPRPAAEPVPAGRTAADPAPPEAAEPESPRFRADFALVPPRSRLSGRTGGGSPLPATVRAEEEARFGVDFGGVRLHDTAAAHRLAGQHLARAFTVGSDVVFNAGRYRPETQDGRGLLVHELAHVVQQSRRAGAAPTGPAHEAAAEASARAVAGGGPVHAGPAAAVGVQCSPLSPEEIARLPLPELEARLRENEREAAPPVVNEEYRAALSAENIRLKQRYAELNRGLPSAGDPVPGVVTAELAEVAALVTRLAADVPAHPRDHALNEVRGVAARLRQDQVFLTGLAGPGGAAAADRVRRLIAVFTPVVAQAERWHTANPAGESLGMRNEAAGTWLAGKALSHWERGGWYYISGAAAFVGTGAVALLDAGEEMLSFGFHDAATAVSQAYTRGDISWNEGESILWSAAWRALLTAAITRGAGAAAGRLGGLAARGAGLAPRTVGYGLTAGAVAGGTTTAASLAAESLLTSALESHFAHPAARAIWRQGIPSGRQWALAIPLGMLLGARSGARAVRLGNARLVGSTFDTPDGRFRILAVTPDGNVVISPVDGLPTPPPPPPPTTIEMVFDPATSSWRAAGATGSAGSPARPPVAGTPRALPGPARGALPAGPAPRALPGPANTTPDPAPLTSPAPAPGALPPGPAPRALPGPANTTPDPAPLTSPAPAPGALPPGPAPRALPGPADTPATTASLISPAPAGTPATPAPSALPPGPASRALPGPANTPATTTPGTPAPSALPPGPAPLALPSPANTPATTTPGTPAPQALSPATSQPQPSLAPAGSPVPSTPRTAAAERRVAETGAALASASGQVAQARARLAAADTALQAARTGKAARPAIRQAETELRRARADLLRLEASETTARLEAIAATEGRAQIARLETDIAWLTRQLDAELNPPGGFTQGPIHATRSPGVVPPIGQATGANYHLRAGQLRAAQRRLADQVTGLRRSLMQQAAAATPGAGARGVALDNARALEEPLRPVGGTPIDVTTGLPMTSSWHTDHLVPRAEIARDVRFALLTPAQRAGILLDVPENYLPLAGDVNSGKSDYTVDEWIARRAASNRPLPPSVVPALRAADARARAAIERAFARFLTR